MRGHGIFGDTVPQKRLGPVKNGSVKKEEEGSPKKKQQAKLTRHDAEEERRRS